MAEQIIAGRYRLERRLGGDMAEVWSATDLELDRKVAVKLLASHADPARFEREARAAAALAHPNICRLYEYGETDGRPFMALEYLSGGSLEDRLAPGRPLPDDDAGRIAAEIAAGLAHAHARGLVHRDLKPANVLFDAQGHARIADLGIARVDDEGGLTEAGTVLGTAAYISPEQVAGNAATPASDVYAFGVFLFRMLAGRLPFEADDAIAVAAMHRDRPAPPVATLRPDAPPRLESIAAAALAKSPSDRPPDGTALAAELAEAVRPPMAETAVTQVVRPPRQRRRAALVATGLAILAAAGVALAVAVTFGSDNKTTSTSSSRSTRPATSSRRVTTAPAPAPAPVETTAQSTAAATRTTSAATTVASATLPATNLPVTTAAPPTTAVVPPPPPPPPPPTIATTVPAPPTTSVQTATETTTPVTTAPATTAPAGTTTAATTAAGAPPG